MSDVCHDRLATAPRTLWNAVHTYDELMDNPAIPVRRVAGVRRPLRLYQCSSGDNDFFYCGGGGGCGGSGWAEETGEEGDSYATGLSVYERFRSTKEEEGGGGGGT